LVKVKLNKLEYEIKTVNDKIDSLSVFGIPAVGIVIKIDVSKE
jgi:hypothetical protein